MAIMRHALKTLVAAAALTGVAAGGFAWAQASQRVVFAKGNDNASVKGTIKGGQYRDYLLGARAGQTMGVSLLTKGSAYFNILPPGSKDVAIYNSSADGQDASVKLSKSGDYRIRVYLMGAAKSSAKPVAYQLSFVIM